MQKFVFGGSSDWTAEDVKRKREIANMLMRQIGTPRNVGEGLSALGRAIAVRGLNRRADARDAELRGDFNDRFAEVAPNKQGLIDLANSPYASKAHKGVIEALMKGVPNYKRGTMNARGGLAVVGEDGPEVVNLPRHAQVYPANTLPFNKPLPNGMDLDPADADELFDLPEAERNKAIERIQNGESPRDVLQPEGWDPRMMVPREESSFKPGAEFQTADLDAFKLMQLEPKYGDPVEADINTTEGGRLSLLRRMMFADAALEDPRLGKAMTRLDNKVASGFGALGRLYTNDEFELGQLMAEQFANAVLRNDSGAQAPEPEVQRYARQYFPLPNEGDSQLQAKKALRREVIRSMVQALGGDAAPAVKQVVQEMDELKRLADVPSTAQAATPDADGWQTVNGVKIRVKQ